MLLATGSSDWELKHTDCLTGEQELERVQKVVDDTVQTQIQSFKQKDECFLTFCAREYRVTRYLDCPWHRRSAPFASYNTTTIVPSTTTNEHSVV